MKNLFIIMFLLSSLMSKFTSAQDWANTSRFKKDNDKLLTSTTSENRVVFMGNSITEGWLKLRPTFFANKPYVNRGISGQTTPQMLVRFRQDVVN